MADRELTAEDRAALLGLARATLTAHLARRPLPPAPAVSGALLKRGAFVTITARGALRGCIGHIAADRELGTVVPEMTVAAAQDDPRFPPVEPDELPDLALEISVLSEAAPVDASRIVAGRDGVIVRRGRNVGLLLPQVARDHHWGPEALLAATCRKAGLPPEAWREPGTELFTFQADVFGEPREEGRGKRDE
ncbi:MAG: AMMECR1 domain-containing protein [Gemmatimonadetes bacterium]|nr:MAG: AMMECR1 domain-containing protein [Gemmatimonadota bacterium]